MEISTRIVLETGISTLMPHTTVEAPLLVFFDMIAIILLSPNFMFKSYFIPELWQVLCKRDLTRIFTISYLGKENRGWVKK